MTDLDQCMDALQMANHIRTRRAELKADVKAGRVQAIDVIADPPEWAEAMPLATLLRAVPGVGKQKIAKWAGQCGVSPATRLANLNRRQRCALSAAVGHRQPKRPGSHRANPWRAALDQANAMRLDRCRLHGEISALSFEQGRARLAALVTTPPDSVLGMRVVDLLDWAPRIGVFHAQRFMRASRVPLGRTVEHITPRQREALAACLKGDIETVQIEAGVREWAARAAA